MESDSSNWMQVVLQVIGYLAGALGFLFVLSRVEPYRGRRLAWQEFGKWLDVLPAELEHFRSLAEHGLKLANEGLTGARGIGMYPCPISCKIELNDLIKIRDGLLGWERSSFLYKEIGLLASATERTNWALDEYNARMQDALRSAHLTGTNGRAICLSLKGSLDAYVAKIADVMQKAQSEVATWKACEPRVWELLGIPGS